MSREIFSIVIIRMYTNFFHKISPSSKMQVPLNVAAAG